MGRISSFFQKYLPAILALLGLWELTGWLGADGNEIGALVLVCTGAIILEIRRILWVVRDE